MLQKIDANTGFGGPEYKAYTGPLRQAFVITVQSIPESVEASDRCIVSGAKYGLEITGYEGFTPADNPGKYLKERGVSLEGFKEVYSRTDRCIAAFCSHFSLWEWSRDTNKEVIIFEHDAVMTSPLPLMHYEWAITFGKPSYGKYKTPY